MITAEFLDTEEYRFLQTNEHLAGRIVLLGVAGSYAYGTNRDGSDIDLRGIALNRKSDLIGMTEFEQYTDGNTDSCIYGFNKIIPLFLACNPNCIELLGLRPEHYLQLSPVGEELIKRRGMFLSRRAIDSFGGYAAAQLRRLQNALNRETVSQAEREANVCRSLVRSLEGLQKRYASFEQGALRLYVDRAENPQLEAEIYMDVTLTHYPLRDYQNLWKDLNRLSRDFDTLGKRNRKKDDAHLNKHAMHLIRLFLMAIDILEKGEILTFREEEHELLMDIRGGAYQREDGGFRDEFYEMISDYERRMDYAAKHTCLPEEPDFEQVEEFVMRVNERVVRDEI